jgi:hypothetical protein
MYLLMVLARQTCWFLANVRCILSNKNLSTSMEQKPSRNTNSPSTGQDIPRV